MNVRNISDVLGTRVNKYRIMFFISEHEIAVSKMSPAIVNETWKQYYTRETKEQFKRRVVRRESATRKMRSVLQSGSYSDCSWAS